LLLDAVVLVAMDILADPILLSCDLLLFLVSQIAAVLFAQRDGAQEPGRSYPH
jgi:hypothetical protein